MRIYLAARYSRRIELCGYRDELVAMGHTVCARWLEGPERLLQNGQRLGDAIERRIERGGVPVTSAGEELLRELATMDTQDIMDCDCFVNFTEPRDSDASRGGRHVELGFLLGFDYTRTKRIIVVGYRENFFHWLECCEFAETWEDAKRCLTP